MTKPLPFIINSQQEGNSTAFIEFMLLAISETLNKNILAKNAPKNTLINAPINPQKTPDAILMLIKNNPKITYQQIADILQKNLRTIGRSIALLQKNQKLTRVGPNKTGHWQIN